MKILNEVLEILHMILAYSTDNPFYKDKNIIFHSIIIFVLLYSEIVWITQKTIKNASQIFDHLKQLLLTENFVKVYF